MEACTELQAAAAMLVVMSRTDLRLKPGKLRHSAQAN